MSNSNAHIFISYAREDRNRVTILAQLFEAEGWAVWWDRDHLPAIESGIVPDATAIDSKRRVVRGGSWRSGLANARATLRLGFFPYKRFGTIGFRVVCSSPIAG